MRFGAHVSAAGGILNALDRGHERGCDVIQIFTQSSRMWRPTAHDPDQLAAYAPRAAELGIATVGHAIYFINLASQDEEIYAKSIASLLQTTDVISRIGGDAVIFHVGSHRGAGLTQVLPRIVAGLEQALDQAGPDTWIALECSAGAGDTIGRTIEELATVVAAAASHPRLGICLDTCHLYVSGVDLRDEVVCDDLIAEIGTSVGLERLRCVHVNDAAAPLGSNRDRHANIGEGELGVAIATLLAHPALEDVPAVLETPGPDGRGTDAAEIALLREYHAVAVRRRAGGASPGTGRRRAPRRTPD